MLLLYSSILFSLFCGIMVIHIISIIQQTVTIRKLAMLISDKADFKTCNFICFREAERRKESNFISIAFSY